MQPSGLSPRRLQGLSEAALDELRQLTCEALYVQAEQCRGECRDPDRCTCTVERPTLRPEQRASIHKALTALAYEAARRRQARLVTYWRRHLALSPRPRASDLTWDLTTAARGARSDNPRKQKAPLRRGFLWSG
jgi:hypothetical protein